ncbi:hypothetical protein GCM10009678_13790 [Actinomadura kijaniata]|uniref:Uncharacterized protein n=1 Tax=Actinomadura namibiensis TaxID=182080 RepID=A0A7W3LQT7_ACTNM|nr:hypothetical protein [Actinomadura namibiensis]MBA8952547.1 hypothetical protein [Actinomadura namibiensis]
MRNQTKVMAVTAGLAIASGLTFGVNATAASAEQRPAGNPHPALGAKLQAKAAKATQGGQSCIAAIDDKEVHGGCATTPPATDFDAFYLVAVDEDGAVQYSPPIWYWGAAFTQLTFKKPVQSAAIVGVQDDGTPGQTLAREGDKVPAVRLPAAKANPALASRLQTKAAKAKAAKATSPTAQGCTTTIQRTVLHGGCGAVPTNSYAAFFLAGQDVTGVNQSSPPIWYSGAAFTQLTFKNRVKRAVIIGMQGNGESGPVLARQTG